MTQSVSNSSGKKLIQIDVSSDTVCPWCFVGKRNLDKAITASEDQFEFEIKWHPFFLNPSAPKEGVYRGLGLEYNISGLTGNTLDSHRLIYFAGQQGLDKQHNLVEELFLGYFTQLNTLVIGSIVRILSILAWIPNLENNCESEKKLSPLPTSLVGVEGPAEFLEDPNNGLKEVNDDLKKYSANITGVPYYEINGKHKLSGGQPPEVFLRAFEAAAN
ncbi:hypothetical protein GH714_018325 [Hevea brasiliensis]|uniref:DSBA-like thioredoxin domain-containing protein n=1 Tax=Hevea brasiliensis TaxID=3981 RepID=A0A6A6KS07_HEVBR|nr:hypothetical protein GH714_018325 [Hevea brasiliensis]